MTAIFIHKPTYHCYRGNTANTEKLVSAGTRIENKRYLVKALELIVYNINVLTMDRRLIKGRNLRE